MAGEVFAFGPFQLETSARRLRRDGEPVALSSRHYELLRTLLERADHIVSKDALIEAAWPDVAVTDNSLEQAISALRRTLGSVAGAPCIETHPRRGYRIAVPVRRLTRRRADQDLDALLAPHRAWIEGRAALESLEGAQILHAREVFEQVLGSMPDQAPAHVGLANAYALLFEMTRLDPGRDPELAARAVHHAREACRLEPGHGEAWATLGFVLDRTEHAGDAVAALRRAVALEPDNWRHHLRLAYGSWGEERLRAARRTLSLLPHFPLAHWLAATVLVARGALDAARRDLDAGIAADESASGTPRFTSVALYWLNGLVRFAEGDPAAALAEFAKELARESSGHLYARECCANTWYAIGAVHAADGRRPQAREACGEALARVPDHPLARVAMATLDETTAPGQRRHRSSVTDAAPSFEVALGEAVRLAAAGADSSAAALLDRALRHAPSGSAGWLLPVEPMLRAWRVPAVWAPTLARLRARAT